MYIDIYIFDIHKHIHHTNREMIYAQHPGADRYGLHVRARIFYW